MIGLLDLDIQTSTSEKLIIPNIEIMKLATYYKVEENHFCRLIDLNEEDLTVYDKIYCFSENSFHIKLPNQFLRADNIILGGTGFTNEKYVPFKNEIIDFTLPRPTIYKEFLKEKYESGIKARVIEHVLDDTYYRMYAGENKLPLPSILPRKRVILFDRDFFYPDWQETLKEIANRKCSLIYRVHPIICNKLTDFFSARNTPKLDRAAEYILDLNIELDELDYLFKNYKNLFLADITTTSNVFLTLGNNYYTLLQYANEISYKLNLLFAFWSRGIFLKIKFIPCKVGFNNPFEDIMKTIESWANSHSVKKEKTILQWIPKKKSFDNIREQYQTLLKYSPKLKTLFNCSIKQIREGGNWRYEY